MPRYVSTKLKQVIEINEVVSVHYFEYMSDFAFQGEHHDFWEFLCVDKGDVEVTADEQTHLLKKGDIVFHKPGEFHTIKANGVIAPNLVVISFACSSESMLFFKDKIFSIDNNERYLLSEIIIESKNAFSGPIDDPWQLQLNRRDNAIFGAEQLIRQYLEHFLINLIRRYSSSLKVVSSKMQPLTKENSDSDTLNKVINYMEKNIGKQLTIDDLCKNNLVGRSHLQKLFRERKNCGVIDYFLKIRINAAKQMIRNNQMNFTEIADALGYTSIHYFSRQFKKITGMTPSEYASSIKGLSEIPVRSDSEN